MTDCERALTPSERDPSSGGDKQKWDRAIEDRDHNKQAPSGFDTRTQDAGCSTVSIWLLKYETSSRRCAVARRSEDGKIKKELYNRKLSETISVCRECTRVQIYSVRRRICGRNSRIANSVRLVPRNVEMMSR
jgi:hypothetical protein